MAQINPITANAEDRVVKAHVTVKGLRSVMSSGPKMRLKI
jgi:hypothetical protein